MIAATISALIVFACQTPPDSKKPAGGKAERKDPEPPPLPKRVTLAEAAKAFISYADCVKRVERKLPPELGPSLVPRSDLPDAICRAREAIARKDPKRCTLVRSYSQRKGCRQLAAIQLGDPSACPLTYAARRGRNGFCLAMAQRDATLCRATKSDADQARCEAILLADADRCSGLRSDAKRSICRSQVGRFPDIKAKAQGALAKDFKPYIRATIKDRAGSVLSTAAFACGEFGVVAPAEGPGKVNFCEFHSYGYRSGSYSYRQPKLKLAFTLPPQGTGTVQLGAGDILAVRLRGSRSEYGTAPSGQITITRFERRRGGRLSGSFELSVGGRRGDEALTLTGTFDTYVRDLVEAHRMRFDNARRRSGAALFGRRPEGGGGGIVDGSRGKRWPADPDGALRRLLKKRARDRIEKQKR